MAYSINLYEFDKRINSTKIPTGYPSLDTSVKLKSGATIEHPIFTITDHSFSSICNYNYLKFQGKYYFIDDIKSINNATTEISASIDVLASYRTAIGNYTCVVSRTSDSNHYNLYDSDNIFPPTNQIKNIFEFETNTNFSFPSSYTITTYGRNGVQCVNTGQYMGLNSALFDNSSLWTSDITNPSQYVQSLIVLPIQPPQGTGTATIKLGDSTSFTVNGWEMSFNNDHNWYSQLAEGYYQFDITSIRSNGGLNYVTDYRLTDKAFTEVHMFLPFVGLINIPSSVLSRQGALKVYYVIDYITGQGECIVKFDVSGTGITDKAEILHKSNINTGATIPIGVSDTTKGEILGNIFNPIFDTIDFKPSETISGLLFPRKNYNMIGSANTTGFYDVSKIKLIITQYQSDDISDYRNTKGVPTNKKLTLGGVTGQPSVNGYIEVLNPSIYTTGKNGTNEKINSFLEGGFYYE